MRAWARWTALLAVGFAAGGISLSGTAFAGTAGGGNSGVLTVLGGYGLLAPSSPPADVCGDASALLGIAAAGCRGGAAAASAGKAPAASGNGPGRIASAGSGHRVHVPVGGSTTSTAVRGTSMPGSAPPVPRQTFSDTLNAPGPGRANSDTPGPGSLPGLAGLSALSGTAGSSTVMPASVLSARDASGMSSNSFAALAIGALSAGAAALKIASRRARDRKAEIGATTWKRHVGFQRRSAPRCSSPGSP
jgi:hypothetical protein